MIAMDNYPEVLRRVEKLKAEHERLRGQLIGLKKQLKDEYGVNGFKAARKLLARLQKRERNAHRDYIRVKKAFIAKWGNRLGLK